MSHDRDHQRARARPGAGTGVDASRTPTAGKQTRVQSELGSVVQRRAAAAAPPATPPADVHAAAASGVAGAGETLPHLDAIQRAFGHHDVSNVRARVGGAASDAGAAIGAEAYTVGETIAFARTPDLRLAAHEAAHVVQQRGGVSVAGGVGEAGDGYERHADEVADAVVAGRSAEALLDRVAAPRARGGATAVQKWEDPMLDERPGDLGSEPAPRDAPPDAPARQGETWHGRATNLRAGLNTVVARGIEAVAGAENTSGEVEIAVEVPIPGQDKVRVAGTIKLTVDHGRQGYRLTGRPELGFAVRGGGAGGRFLSQLALDVRGHDAATAASLIGLAIERELRAMASEPPPAIVTTAIMTMTGLYGLLLYAVWDVSGRLGSYLRRGTWEGPFYPWLADMLFGREHAHIVQRAMRDGDYAETVDGARATGAVSDRAPDGVTTSGEAEARLGQHRRVAHEDGAVRESEYHALDIAFAFETGGWKVAVEVNEPVTGDDAPPTKYTFTVGKSFRPADVGTFIATDALAAACSAAIRRIRDWVDGSPQRAVRDVERVREASQQAASLAHSFVAGHAAGAAGGGEVGASIELEATHGEPALKVTVKFHESVGGDLGAEGQGSTFNLRHGRVIADFEFGW
jgi:hypothetical protein